MTAKLFPFGYYHLFKISECTFMFPILCKKSWHKTRFDIITSPLQQPMPKMQATSITTLENKKLAYIIFLNYVVKFIFTLFVNTKLNVFGLFLTNDTGNFSLLVQFFLTHIYSMNTFKEYVQRMIYSV